MANKGIDFVLALNATKYQSALNAVTSKTKAAGAAIDSYWKRTAAGARSAGDAFTSMRTKVIGAVAAIGGIYAVKATFDSVTGAAMEADKATFNLGTSIQAANREFTVGSSESWRQNIAALNKELKIYSTQTLEQAASKTVDMTKRLGLSEQQMVKVMRAAANLGAGKFELSESVERVTSALRGEAEASEMLGLTLNENYVKAWYEAKGATQGAWKDLNDIQKAQIRFNVLLQQSDPLLGKAAASSGTYGGALTKLQGIYDGIKAVIGEVITRNNFFIEGINKITGSVGGLGKDIGANKTKWMEWSKQGSLAVLDFGEAGVRAAGSVYVAFNAVAGGIKEVSAKYYELKAVFLEGGSAGAKWKDMLGITSGEAAKLAKESAEAASKSEALRSSAQRSFAEMDAGSPKINALADNLRKFRDEMAQVAAKEIIPADTNQKAVEAQQEIVKIGDKWVGVAQQINSEKIKPQIEIEQEAYAKSMATLREAVEKQAEAAAKANKEASKDVSQSWDGAADAFESKWEQVIRNIASQFDNLWAKASRAESASQGASGNYADGGRVRGWSPHSRADNINAWLTAGEFVHPVARVRQYGLAFMEAVRSGTFPASLALAGISGRIGSLMAAVPTGPALAAGGVAGGGNSMTVNFAFGGGTPVGPFRGTRDMAIQLEREFARRAQRSSR